MSKESSKMTSRETRRARVDMVEDCLLIAQYLQILIE